MSNPIIEAIDRLLLDKAIAFADDQSLLISLQNGVGTDGRHFKKPAPNKTTSWLRATILPAPSLTMGISYSAHVKHYGILQIDVIHGEGGGTTSMKQIVDSIRSTFPMGLRLVDGDLVVEVNPYAMRVVTQGPLMNDSPGWVKIPVSIPWVCYERPA